MKKIEVMPLMLSLKALLQDNQIKEATDLIDRVLAIKEESYGGEEQGVSGMTDLQYKGMLVDQLACWERVLEMAKNANSTAIQTEIELQIKKIHNKMRF